MMISLLFGVAIFGFQNEQELRNIQQSLDKLLEKPACTVELQLVSNNAARRVRAENTAVIPLSFFVAVSKPEDQCLPVEIRVTVSYLDAADNLICSGTIENVAQPQSLTETINLDVRPYNLQEFVSWKNEPPASNSGAKRLVCFGPDGVAEATPEQLRLSTTVQLRTTSLPPGGDVATAEIGLNLQR